MASELAENKSTPHVENPTAKERGWDCSEQCHYMLMWQGRDDSKRAAKKDSIIH